MKKLKVTILLIVLAFTSLQAQNEKRFEKPLKAAIEDLGKAGTVEELTPIANKLERINTAEPGEWLPVYYLGYTYLNMAIVSRGDEADRYLNITQQHLDKLMKMQPDNSEVVALQGYKDMIYMVQDQAARAQEYSPKIMQTFGRAIALDPHNPRAILLMGQMKYGMAQFFGSSFEEPCGMVQKALQLLAKQEGATLQPSWGREPALAYAKKCDEGQALKE